MSTHASTEDSGHRLSNRTVFPTVGAIVLVLAVLTWVPSLIDPLRAPIDDPPPYVAALLIALFVLAELLPLRVEVHRATLLVSLSELPLVLAVLLLPTWLVGVSYLAGGLVVYLIRRDAWRNALMNLSLIAVESGAAVMTVTIAGVVTPPGDMVAAGQRFLPAAGGVLIGALISAVAVGVAYRLVGPGEPVLRVVARSVLTAAIIVGFALTGFTVWNAPMGGPVLCLALLVLLALLYRSYSVFLRQHTDLEGMYAFGRAVTNSAGRVAEWHALLEQVCDQLSARVAVLHLTDRPSGPWTIAAGLDGAVRVPELSESDPLLIAAAEHGSAHASQTSQTEPEIETALMQRDAFDVMVVPLRAGDRYRGYLEVRDKRTRWAKFSDDDMQLLQALGGHLATALDNHRLLQRLQHEAHHDAVTGLRNRAGLRIAAEEAEKAGHFGGILLLELNMLGNVNSALGHDKGEQLLRVAGDRIVEAAGEGCTVGRIETDRFAVLMAEKSEEPALSHAGRILTAARQLLSTEGIEIEADASAGLALVASTDPDDIGESALLQRAELALMAAQTGGEHLAIYRAAMGEKYQRRFQLVTQFRRAVDSGRVTLHYQPKLTLVDRELIGVEALVRWMHPEYGFVSPAELIDAIENTASIDVLFMHVLDQALAQIVEWNSRGRRIEIAVNLSVRNLLAPNFTKVVTDALERHQAPAELLTLEITESSVMDQPERSLPVLRELHSIGIQLSVDDFGTGYSSLAYLRRLPIDEIKIDKSFVQGMVTDLGDLAIVRAIIDLGHSLGLRVIAEGVEEEAGRDALRSMRCDAMQGFLLSRPLPIDRFETWLASRAVTSEIQAGEQSAPLRIRA